VKWGKKDTNKRKQNMLILTTTNVLLVHTEPNHTHRQQTNLILSNIDTIYFAANFQHQQNIHDRYKQ